jgi:hypothetical protein
LAGEHELIVYLECKHDRVILHPVGDTFLEGPLGAATEKNALVQAVRRYIASHQARRLAEAPPLRVELRYLVRSDGGRIAHQAQEVLGPLGLPQQQHQLQPEDDVSAIVAGR